MSAPQSPTYVEHTASWARRVLALVIDWAASTLVTLLVLGTGRYSDQGTSWVTLGIYALETTVGTALAGGSFGQLATGIRVLTVDRRPLGLVPALARTILICAVVPPLVFRPDGRGLHDVAARSAAFDLRALREG